MNGCRVFRSLAVRVPEGVVLEPGSIVCLVDSTGRVHKKA